MTVPLYFHWDGESMTPLSPKLADRQFVVGEKYRLEVREERSDASHNHYFAAVHDAWMNLPDELSERFPTDNHLRKWCLIKAGFRRQRTVVCTSPLEARKIAAWGKQFDDYAVVVARRNVVVAWTAKSQSTREMGKEEFQRSKEAVLGVLEQLLKTTPGDLERNAGQAA